MFNEKTKLYDIPLSHLDFTYITDCNKIKELEKILKVLRSGCEGRYPELERHCEEKLLLLDPENRLLRKPGALLSSYQLAPEEREEIEHSLHEWLEETKNQECLSSNTGRLSTIDESENLLVPKVRQLGEINPVTGKGTRVQTSKRKSTKLRTYEEWNKLEKEIEKELESEENKEQTSNVEVKHNDVKKSIPENMVPRFSSLQERVRSMPSYLRAINAQREKEKGNEALITGDFSEALEYYERSLIYKQTTAVYNNRALLYLKQKKWRLAVADSSRVLGEEPKNIKALLRRAQAFYELHSLDKAQSDLEFVLEMDPQNSRASKLLKTVKEDHASRQRSHLKGGRRMVIDEVDDDPDESYSDAEDEKNVQTALINSEDTRMPPPIKRGVEIEEIFDEDPREVDSVTSNKVNNKVPPVRRGAEIEEIFNEVPKSQKKSTVSFTIPNDEDRRYSELIDELQRKETSKLKAALDVKLDVKLLEEYIIALKKVGLPKGDYDFMHKSLEMISQSARFTVAAMMLSDSAIQATEDIFNQLRSISSNPNSLDVLQSRFLNY